MTTATTSIYSSSNVTGSAVCSPTPTISRYSPAEMSSSIVWQSSSVPTRSHWKLTDSDCPCSISTTLDSSSTWHARDEKTYCPSASANIQYCSSLPFVP